MKRIAVFLGSALAALIGVLLFNTFQFKSNNVAGSTLPAPELPADALEHFRQAISFKTVSYGDSSLFDSTQFLGFQKFLQESYPNVHAKLTREVVAGYSLVYKWEGSNIELKPIILMAHQDVVPIEEETKTMWTVDPFAGQVKDDFIWGRGTADDKINLISIVESAEKLLKEGYQPERTVYLAFGHDEERGGSGARAMAALFKSRGIEADLVLDEGGVITRDKVPDMPMPVALIGTSEKGYLSLELIVEKNGGHSSMPESETSIDILSKAIVKLRNSPFEPEFSESTRGLLDHIGPEMSFPKKLVLANRWLFKSLIFSSYEKTGGGNAMIRTTAAPTILSAGMKDNVIPTVAKAVINFRILPGNTSDDVIAHVKEAMHDERVRVRQFGSFLAEATNVTSEKSFAYKKVEEVVRKSIPQTITAPFLMIAATDSRHFGEVSSGIIKFSPMTDPIGFHGIDERVSVESFRSSVWFYEQLLRNTN